MDECIDAGDVSMDTSAIESVDLPAIENVEPLVDIPVEEPTMDYLSDSEPVISESELTDLGSEVEALGIQPLEEIEPLIDDGLDAIPTELPSEEHDFHELQPTDFPQDNENSGSYSPGQRIVAGITAPFVALDPLGAQIQDMRDCNIPNDVPAIYQETDYVPQTPEQIVEQYQQDGWIISDGTNEKRVDKSK
ncbi:MAG: hypothetical protein FWG79_09215 [Bacteroidales bacterium]|nr:hypothetical protein [Bacteroidales bacterium]